MVRFFEVNRHSRAPHSVFLPVVAVILAVAAIVVWVDLKVASIARSRSGVAPLSIEVPRETQKQSAKAATAETVQLAASDKVPFPAHQRQLMSDRAYYEEKAPTVAGLPTAFPDRRDSSGRQQRRLRSSGFPLDQELSLIALTPYALPAIVLILMISFVPKKRRSSEHEGY